jgi:hypothetical protein
MNRSHVGCGNDRPGRNSAWQVLPNRKPDGRTWAKNPDIAEDVRMMGPVFFDRGRGKTKVWAILGWARRPLQISYVVPPIMRAVEGGPHVDRSTLRFVTS